MRKFASFFAISATCVCLSVFAQEIEEETVNNSEVSVSNDDVASSDNGGDVVPQHSEEADCGCGGKPKN